MQRASGCDPVLVTRRDLPHQVPPRHPVDGGVVIVLLDEDVQGIEAEPLQRHSEMDNRVYKLDAVFAEQNA